METKTYYPDGLEVHCCKCNKFQYSLTSWDLKGIKFLEYTCIDCVRKRREGSNSDLKQTQQTQQTQADFEECTRLLNNLAKLLAGIKELEIQKLYIRGQLELRGIDPDT